VPTPRPSGRGSRPARTPGATRRPGDRRTARAARAGRVEAAGLTTGPTEQPSQSDRARRAAAGAGSGWRSSALTGRAAVLGLVVCALVLSLVYPAKQYLSQRGVIAELTRQQAAAERRVALLEAQARQLRDPAYLRAQARKRLQFVMPGDTVYIVVNGDGQPSTRAAGPPVPAAGSAQPWYAELWRTVEAADQAP